MRRQYVREKNIEECIRKIDENYEKEVNICSPTEGKVKSISKEIRFGLFKSMRKKYKLKKKRRQERKIYWKINVI